jgi:amidase
MSQELIQLDATAQAALVQKGEATPLELVDAAIARIEKIDPELNAVIHPLFEKARAQARSPELPAGPFRGVPFLLKDLVASSAGDPFHNGMKLLKDLEFRGPQDTYLVEKLRNAGFVVVGRTNTPELGLADTTEPIAYGPSRNPWNPERSTGGSSGGSAAAVASRLVPAAHANDGGGSIRIPASECGLVGLKPSRGRVSVGPLAGEALHGLAIEGAVSISVRDTAAILDAISGPMPGDPYIAPPPRRPYVEELGRDPGRLRVGLMLTRPGAGAPLHPECVEAVERAGRLLESLGHSVEISHPDALDEPTLLECFEPIFAAHTAHEIELFGELLGRAIEKGDVEDYTWRFVEEGRKVGTGQYLAAVDSMHQWSRRVAGWWAEGFDVLVTPTIAEPPPPLGQLGGDAADPLELWERNLELLPFTPNQNATGQPAISLPLHWTADGLPVGVHFVPDYGREDLLIRLASQLEQAQPWADRLPGIRA